MTHQEMIDHNKRVIENITNRREKANLELDNFFASKANKAPFDIHPKVLDLSSVKQSQGLLSVLKANQ